MSQDAQDKESGGRSGRRGAIRGVYKDLGVFGGIRSIGATAKQGSDAIAVSAQAMAEATRRSLEPARHETFAQALARLGVLEEDLPIIHNQIILQMHLALVVAAIALVGSIVYFAKGQIMAPLISLVIFLTCLVKASQSSIHCMSIRHRRLGLNAQWLASPGEWLPKRIFAERAMEKNDPLRDPEIVNGLARNARRSLTVGVSLIGLSVLWTFLFPGNQWPLLYVGAGLMVLFSGSKNSFEVFKRRRGIHCDVAPWLTDPTAWFPEMEDKSARMHVKSDPKPEFKGFVSLKDGFRAANDKEVGKD